MNSLAEEWLVWFKNFQTTLLLIEVFFSQQHRHTQKKRIQQELDYLLHVVTTVNVYWKVIGSTPVGFKLFGCSITELQETYGS